MYAIESFELWLYMISISFWNEFFLFKLILALRKFFKIIRFTERNSIGHYAPFCLCVLISQLPTNFLNLKAYFRETKKKIKTNKQTIIVEILFEKIMARSGVRMQINQILKNLKILISVRSIKLPSAKFIIGFHFYLHLDFALLFSSCSSRIKLHDKTISHSFQSSPISV